MDRSIIALNIGQFSLVYLLLLLVLGIMKKCHVRQSKLLILASIRMSLQLVLAGFVLTYLFEHPQPIFVAAYLLLMLGMACHTVLARNQQLGRPYIPIVFCSLAASSLFIILFFLLGVIRVSFWNPQYCIPISGMIIGNAMTGISLGLKSFHEQLQASRGQIETLLYWGAEPKRILTPYINKALETALLPSLNSMLGMGVISLPGMMTGQILSGTLPTTAILYQIGIMLCVCSAVCMAVFIALKWGSRLCYNKRKQLIF